MHGDPQGMAGDGERRTQVVVAITLVMMVFNCSDEEWVHAVVARSDASEWQNIIPYDRDSD